MAGHGMTDKTMDMPAFAGVVLAGGRSSRMGRDKAELVYQGHSLLAHMLARLQECGAHPILISGPARDGYTTVPDRTSGPGALGRNSRGAHQTDGWDRGYPAADRSGGHAGFTQFDVDRLDTIRPPDAACHYTHHPLPLGLAVNHSALATLSSLLHETGLADSQRSMQAFCDRLKARSLPLPHVSTAEFQSLNTPAEWASFSAAHIGAQAG